MQDLFEKPSRRLAEEDKRQMNLELLPERDNVRVYKDAFDLLLFVYRTTATMRREYRFTLAEEMKRALQQLLTSIYEAKKTTPRSRFIMEAMHWCYEAKVLYRLMDELHLLRDWQCVTYIKQLSSISKQLTNWFKFEKKKENESLPHGT